MRYQDRTETTLIQNLQAGDQQALGALYDRLAPVVNAVILRILGNRADAEEILEETFWHIWQDARAYDPARGTLAAWVITIARSRALDRLRVQKRQAGNPAASAEEASAALTAEPLTPEDTTLQNERARAVADALRVLPLEQRLPIELAYYEGLSQSQIADRLSQPLGTVKTRVRLGFARLREALRSYGGATHDA
jgi:RNA polymerase sigma-70 factor (ECF subfamily)